MTIAEHIRELIDNNHHREAAVQIAEAVGDIWLLQKAQNLQWYHARHNHMPHHLQQECADVDRQAHQYLERYLND